MSEINKSSGSVRVLFFSVLQDAAGGEKEIDWPLGERANSVGDLLEEVYARWPELKSWDGQIRVAVDLEYSDREHVLADGQEIALIPPVQGG